MDAESLDRHRRAGAVFDAVSDRPREERASRIAAACGGDEALRREVERLLLAHDAAGAFLETGALELAVPLLREAWADARTSAPDRLGPYRVVREIGHGGMGSVFLAERDDGQFAQRVAIKLVNPLAAQDRLIPRFLEERRILARLEHPGIARLIDGGVAVDGTPWFAMEYVDGQPIDAWCDERRLPIDRRLQLFLSACEAVQHAHHQFVIHRDLKPSNIFVTSEGQVRLLDFGIAKFAAPDDVPAGNDAVNSATFRIMTPQYAAPEQVRGEPVTAASDVYALGMLLYQLLTGRRPYEVRGLTPGEIERIVCNTEPLPPSTAFAANGGSDDDRRARARLRASTPERLRRSLRGDLDAIVLQALRKDPARRYPTATALLEDLQRARRGDPVRARPDSAGYRLRRFVSRNRVGVGAVAVIISLLSAGAWRERSLRQAAERETRKATAVGDFMLSVFDVADPYRTPVTSGGANTGRDVTARELVDRGVTRVGRELGSEPAVAAELRSLFARVYTSLGVYDAAEEQARRALAEHRALYGRRHPEVAEALDQLAQVLMARERYDEAEPLLREALAQRRELLGARDPATLMSLDHLGTLLQDRGALVPAESTFRELLAARRETLAATRNVEGLATALNNLALVLFVRGRYDEAEPLYREAIPLYQQSIGADHPTTAAALQNLAQVQQLRGHADEAEDLFRAALQAKRRALGDRHPSVTISLNNMASFLARDRGKVDEADSLAALAVSLDRQIFGNEHGFVAAGLNNQSLIARLRGDFSRAEQLALEAVRIGRAVLPAGSKDVAAFLNSVGAARYAKGDLPGATAAYRDALAEYDRALGAQHLYTLTVAVSLGRTLRERGLLDEADQRFQQAMAALDSTSGAHRVPWSAARLGHAQVLLARGKVREALPLLEAAYAGSRALNGDAHWRTAEAAIALGEGLEASGAPGDRARAASLARVAQAILAAQRRAQPRLAASADSLRARTGAGEVPVPNGTSALPSR